MKDNITALQIKIYTRKFWRTQKKDSLISILLSIVIFVLVLGITKGNMLQSFGGTRSGFFSIVSACIWIGIFNSIQLICREKNDIVKDELDKGLKASAYIGAHFVYQFFLCLIQSLIAFILCVIMIEGFMSGGIIFGAGFEYFFSIFLMIFSADAIALVISSVVSTPVVAMTVMPLVLILQLVMAGVIFELKGFTKLVSGLTVSKWGMRVMGSIGGMNNMVDNIYLKEYDFTYKIPHLDDVYEATAGNMFLCWFALIAFIVLSFIISVAALKLTTKHLKK